MAVNRWFTRCTTCLGVAAIDEPPTSELRCGICSGHLENMGRVERDRLINEHTAAICDDRCTSARGPICNCHCGGQHHGSHRVVRVVRDAGPVPTVTPSAGREQARINAAEYLAVRGAALARLDVLLAKRQAGYLPAAEYADLQRVRAALRKGVEARTHAARLKALRAVVGYIPTPELDPVQSIAATVHQAIATAPAI